MERKYALILGLLYLSVLGIRLYFSLSTPNLSYEAYFGIRVIEQISDGNVPLLFDPLSYGGRTLIFPPLFYYFMAMLNIVFSIDFITKIAPQLIASTLPLIVFFAARQLTHESKSAIFSAVLSAALPVYLSETLFSFSPIILVAPLIYLLIVLLFTEHKNVTLIVTVSFLLSLAHPSIALFIAGFLIYLALNRLAGIGSEKSETELILFSTFLFLWVQFILYKNAFLLDGFSVLKQNIPNEVIAGYFSEVSILGALFQIGVVPIMGGIYSIYRYLFKAKTKLVYLHVALVLTSALATWLGLVQPSIGFIYLAISLCILSAPAYNRLAYFLSNVRFSPISRFYIIGVALVLVASMVVPSIYFSYSEKNNTVPEEVNNAMLWIRINTPKFSTILTTLKEGHLITAIAERRNVVDDNFVLIDNPELRLNEARTIFTTPFLTEATRLMEKYDVDYTLVSHYTRSTVGELKYNADCLKKVYNKGNTVIYRSECATTDTTTGAS